MASNQDQLEVRESLDDGFVSREVRNSAGNNITTPPATEQDQIRSVNQDESQPLPQLPKGPPDSQTPPRPFHGQTQPTYVPYSGQTNQPFAYATPVRQLPQLSSTYLTTRLGLTVLSSVWDIIIIALTSVLLSQGGPSAEVALYAYVFVGLSIIWNVAELITYFVRSRKQVQRGIHPGAHVGVHLILWLFGLLAFFGNIAIYSITAHEVDNCGEPQSGGDDNDFYVNDDDFCSEFESLDRYQSFILPLFRAFMAIYAIWLINHFVLFILACIETHRRNRLKRAAVVMTMAAPDASLQAGMQPMQPMQTGQPGQPGQAVTMQYYPYPIVIQPQEAAWAGLDSQSPASNQRQPQQALTGFFAPSSNAVNTRSPAQNAEHT
ncbi:hypothetical protein GGR50DRAFT_259804 [Xylaria sp. CBS 124048]|nr:hypothetical protein GGR50DRAFT_259804 [Xylaria sp. CBS 124048]